VTVIGVPDLITSPVFLLLGDSRTLDALLIVKVQPFGSCTFSGSDFESDFSGSGFESDFSGSGFESDFSGSDFESDWLGVDVEFDLLGSVMAFVLFAVVTAEGERGRTAEKIPAATTRVTALVPRIRGNLLGMPEKEPAPIGDREGLL
jgi:hypothetical protein